MFNPNNKSQEKTVMQLIKNRYDSFVRSKKQKDKKVKEEYYADPMRPI